MRKLFGLIRPNLIKLTAVAMPLAFTFREYKVKVRMETAEVYKEMTKEEIAGFTEEEDVVFVLNLDQYVADFKAKTIETLTALKKTYPNIRIYNISSELVQANEARFGKITEKTMILAKKAGNDQYNPIELATMYFSPEKLSKYFENLPKYESLNNLRLSKFDYLIGYCGSNRKAEQLMKEMALNDQFQNTNFHIACFDCEYMQAKPADLLVLKKYSKFNSQEVGPTKSFGEQSFDYKKSESFFDKEEVKLDSLMGEVSKIIDQISIFIPGNVAQNISKQYTAFLNVDMNKITNRERQELMAKVKKIKTNLTNKNKKKVHFCYNTKSLDEGEASEFVLYDELKANVKTAYNTEQFPYPFRKQLLAKFPYLTDTSNTYTYKYDMKEDKLDTEGFVSFLNKLEQGTQECQHKSEKPKQHKVSNKLVFQNFRQIFEDNKDHIVLFYDKHDELSQRIGRFFEEEAMSNIKTNKYQNLQFNRINNKLNSFFSRSPIIAYFKSGTRLPYYYRFNEFNPTEFQAFLDNTNRVEVIKDFKLLETAN